MKIFYAVQATGNGHISRATELLPYLREYGHVDIFLSGDNAQLGADLPVAFRSKGVSLFYDQHGGLDHFKTFMSLHPARIWREARHLPLDKYDLILNDFEFITSLACRLQHRVSLHFGHQAAFQSDQVPRPEKRNRTGEFILKHYAHGTVNLGLHFRSYDDNICTPVIRQKIFNAPISEDGFISVYLPQYSTQELVNKFARYKEFLFHIHTREHGFIHQENNIKLFPIDAVSFAANLQKCTGLITGAGFETPAEALTLGKKLMVIPIQNHYEQLCNAEALKEWNVPCMPSLYSLSRDHIYQWLYNHHAIPYSPMYSTSEIAALAIKISSQSELYEQNLDIVSTGF